MKKNLITIVILALVLANLILTAILAFTIIPQTKKSNALIDQVCSAINLELEAGNEDAVPTVPPEDTLPFTIADKFSVNLKPGEDGEDHIAVFGIGLTVNKKSEVFKTYAKDDTLTGLTEKEVMIQDAINTAVSGFTIDEFRANEYQDVKDAIMVRIQGIFGGSTDFIVAVNFSGVQSQ